ncbi:hypothetical protein, partial [Klebsiella pneumoniae]
MNIQALLSEKVSQALIAAGAPAPPPPPASPAPPG